MERYRHAIQIDLRAGEPLIVEGYPEHVIGDDPAGIRADARIDDTTRIWFVRGQFPAFRQACDLEGWLHRSSSVPLATWADVPGDFNVIEWNRADSYVRVVTDRTGSHRLYVHAEGGIVTVTDRLIDQARLQRSPAFSLDGVWALFATGYPRDPDSLLARTSTLTVGGHAIATGDGCTVDNYYSPVPHEGPTFRTEDEAVGTLDERLRAIFKCITQRPVVVMLSGGIDSLLMLRYATEAGSNVRSLTFAIEDQQPNELTEGRIAASFYHTDHIEIVLSRSDIGDLLRRSLIESDYAAYGAFQALGARDQLSDFVDDERLTVCRGEDTRLASPVLDLSARIMLQLYAVGAHKHTLTRHMWEARRLSLVWPFRRGQGFLRHLDARTTFRSDLGNYLLEVFGRYSPDTIVGLTPPWLDHVHEALNGCQSLDDVHHALVELAYPLQYTEDMHGATASMETAQAWVTFPFMDPSFVQEAARVPAVMAIKSHYVGTRLTRNPIPFVDKHILRELLGDESPPALRYRRKATTPAMDLLFQVAGEDVVHLALRGWRDALVNSMPEQLRPFVLDRLDAVEASRGAEVSWALGAQAMALVHLAVLARVMQGWNGDVSAVFEDLKTARH